jgi:hypothetical protein
MKIALLALVATAGIAQADIITQWDFNSLPSDNSSSTGTLTPNVGTGTASLVGGTTATFASGNASGGSTDPDVSLNDSGWNVTTWAAQSTASGERGVAFFGSTVGFTDIIVTFDQRHSNTVSAFFGVDYTADGGATWTNATIFQATAGDTWFNNRTVDLSSIAAVENNPNFGFRVVAVFAPTGGYVASSPTGTYGSTGTARFDMVTINGVIPTPGALALASIGGLLAARRRRA